MIIGVIFIALFTVAFGRIFCGWIVPSNHIHGDGPLEGSSFGIDGDRGAQIRLSKQPWNAEKIRKRGLKLIVFFIISF